MIVIERPVGDLEPPLALRLTMGKARTPIPTDGATTTEWVLYEALTGKHLLQRDGEMFPGSEARLTWQTGDPIETRGLYLVTFRLEWPGLRPQTIPSQEADKLLLRVH